MKISAVYKITNTITGDFYIGSSKDVKNRWTAHKCQSTWNKCPNNPMYIDMRKYGVDSFDFQILEEVEAGKLKEKEQKFIETLNPTYNNYRAKGLDVERKKEYNKEYQKSDKGKEIQRKANRKYKQSDKGKECKKKSDKKYKNQLCCYNGEVLTLCALAARFSRAGIPHPVLETKKYLLNK